MVSHPKPAGLFGKLVRTSRFFAFRFPLCQTIGEIRFEQESQENEDEKEIPEARAFFQLLECFFNGIARLGRQHGRTVEQLGQCDRIDHRRIDFRGIDIDGKRQLRFTVRSQRPKPINADLVGVGISKTFFPMRRFTGQGMAFHGTGRGNHLDGPGNIVVRECQVDRIACRRLKTRLFDTRKLENLLIDQWNENRFER